LHQAHVTRQQLPFENSLLAQEGTKAWVAHPRAARVNGVIHFLGGAFAGAAPQLLYNGFIELLADAGYTTIATPYAGELRLSIQYGPCCLAALQSSSVLLLYVILLYLTGVNLTY
jgi:hypothetical protein